MAQTMETNTGERNLAAILEQNNSQSRKTAYGDHDTKYLSFLLSEEVYGIDILTIKEIIEYANVCKVPMVSDHIRGVINLRGNVVPVIDLAKRLGCEASPITKRTCIVMLEIISEGETIDIGIVVDAVNEVLEIPQDEIETTPSFGVNIKPQFIYGMGRVLDNFIVLLDLPRVLDIVELAELGFD
jgi:purine-binding chemotaxis protein CheW